MREEIIDKFKNDDKFKTLVIDTIISNEEILDELTRNLFAQPVELIGMNCYGTIAEFFQNKRFSNVQ